MQPDAVVDVRERAGAVQPCLAQPRVHALAVGRDRLLRAAVRARARVRVRVRVRARARARPRVRLRVRVRVRLRLRLRVRAVPCPSRSARG